MKDITKTFDVAVVGLGAVGSAALYQLSKLGINVIGIDTYAPPHAHGSSHGESRVSRQALGEGSYYVPIVKRANEIWAELETLSGEELYNHCGMLLISQPGREFFDSTLAAAKEHDVAYELLDSRQVTERFPAIKIYDPEDAYYYEADSGYLKPEKCIEVQLKLAQKNGATVRQNLSVRSIREESNPVTLEMSNGEKVMADKVIVATGAWISELLPASLRYLFKTYLQTLYWFDFDESYYEQLTPSEQPVLLTDVQYGNGPVNDFYGFPALAGINGGVKFATHTMDWEALPENKDTITPPDSSRENLYKQVARHVKYVRPTIKKSLNCLYTVTPDEDFIIDFAPGSQRIVIASPCSGHGFKHSAATGQILAQLATQGKAGLDISKFLLNRFTAV